MLNRGRGVVSVGLLFLFFSFAMSTLSTNSASLFAYVGVFVFCCGISGISTDSTLNGMAV